MTRGRERDPAKCEHLVGFIQAIDLISDPENPEMLKAIGYTPDRTSTNHAYQHSTQDL